MPTPTLAGTLFSRSMPAETPSRLNQRWQELSYLDQLQHELANLYTIAGRNDLTPA